MRIGIILYFILLFAINAFGQGIDISDYLKKIESGKIEEVKEKLPGLKTKYPDDPSVLFLDGILTENGKTSLTLFSTLVNNFPESKYADAAVFRIYSYYFASEMFPEAANWLTKLKKDYPSSPYIKLTKQNMPPVGQKDNIQINKKSDSLLKYKYTIQAGAFSNRENANSLKKQFTDAGYSTELKEKTVAGTVFLVIYVGKFISETEAANFLKQLNSNYNLDGRVININ
jgi:SPOR domain